MNEINNLNINCLEHGNENYNFLCIPCKKPICSSCVVDGNHINHKQNKIEFINIINIITLIEEFKINTFQALCGYFESDKVILTESESCIKELSINNDKYINKCKSIFKSIHERLDFIKKDILTNKKSNNYKVIINNTEIDKIKYLRYKIYKKDLKEVKGYSMIKKLFKFNDSYIYFSHGEPVPKNQNKLMIDYRVDYNNFTVPDHIEEIHLLKNQKLKNNDNNNIKTLYLHDMKYSQITFKNIENCYRCYKNKNKNGNKNEFEIVKQYKLHGWDFSYTINNNILNNFTFNEILPPYDLDVNFSFSFFDIYYSNIIVDLFKTLETNSTPKKYCFIKYFDLEISNLIKYYKIKELFLFDIENQIQSIPKYIYSLYLKGTFDNKIDQNLINSSKFRNLYIFNNSNIEFDFSSEKQSFKIIFIGVFYSHKTKGIKPDEIILYKMDHQLTNDHIPDGVEAIRISVHFNQILKKEILPPSLKYILYHPDVDNDLVKSFTYKKTIVYDGYYNRVEFNN